MISPWNLFSCSALDNTAFGYCACRWQIDGKWKTEIFVALCLCRSSRPQDEDNQIAKTFSLSIHTENCLPIYHSKADQRLGMLQKLLRCHSSGAMGIYDLQAVVAGRVAGVSEPSGSPQNHPLSVWVTAQLPPPPNSHHSGFAGHVRQSMASFSTYAASKICNILWMVWMNHCFLPMPGLSNVMPATLCVCVWK